MLAANNVPGTCNVALKGIDITELYTYGRGKGVTMEFARFKAAGRQVVTLQRAGRVGDASFAVKGTIERFVDKSGLVTRAPSEPRLEPTCPTATETPATRPGCNTPFGLSADVKFLYAAKAGTLKLIPTSKETLGASTPVQDCPQSEISPALSGLVPRGWPTPLGLPTERLSTRTIFGNQRSFKLTFHGVEPAKLVALPPTLTGSLKVYSGHNAVVRFTRLG